MWTFFLAAQIRKIMNVTKKLWKIWALKIPWDGTIVTLAFYYSALSC